MSYNRFTQTQTVPLDDFLLTRIAAAPGERLAPHVHRSPSMLLVISGSAIESGVPLASGSAIARRAGTKHQLTFGTSGCTLIGIRTSQPIDDAEGRFSSIAARIELELHSRDAARPIALRALLLRLIAAFAQQKTLPAIVFDARDVVESRFQQPIGLRDVADAVHVDVSRLARAYRSAFGFTVGAHIRRLRADRAAELLGDAHLPIAEVAKRCGFFDTSHLIRAFEAEYGVKPSAFRETLERIR